VSDGERRIRSHLVLLAGLARTRAASLLRRPTPPVALGVLLPLLVVGSALWTLGRSGVPAVDGVEGGVTLGLLVAGAVSFLAYGLLFGGSDRSFLREIGIDFRALFLERGARLAVTATLTALAVAVPFLAAGEPAARPLLIGLAAAFVATAGAAVAYALAARAQAGGGPRSRLGFGIGDPELARAAPLVYAPLVPFLAGAVYGGFAGGAEGAPLVRTGAALGLGLAGVVVGARVFHGAAPRFLARVGEMGYAPPPEGEGERFRVGRGLSALLPRRAAAVWVRDATVAGRRLAWASRVTWPVAILSIVALARWGGTPGTRAWVLAAVGLGLVIQSAAVVALGVVERAGPRWLDRAVGLAGWERFLGRWAWAWGLSLWLLVPVGLAWTWWSGAGGAYLWPLAGAGTAALAAGASLVNAKRR
jgi:hypothetical protein